MPRLRTSRVAATGNLARSTGTISRSSTSIPPTSFTSFHSTDDDRLGQNYSERPDSPYTTSTFMGVFIPKMESSAFKRPLPRAKSASSLSSVDSPQSFLWDIQSEYDTPGTSVSVTPADSTASLQSVTSARLQSNGKRKRKIQDLTANVNNTLSDALLARSLQEEEYGIKSTKRAKGKSGLTIVSNSTSEDDELSSIAAESSEAVATDSSEDDFLAPTARKRRLNATLKRQRFSKTTAPRLSKAIKRKRSTPFVSLPKRKARSVASKAISNNLMTIEDSELSDLNSDELFEGDSEDDMSIASSALSEVATGAQAAHPGRQSFADWSRDRDSRRSRGRAAKERKKLEIAHPEIKTMWKDLEDIPKIPVEQAEQPESITRMLKSFQLEGLNWMIKQEQTQWNGGLLGDEMGMGKTIQAVSLIMSDYPAKAPTLVVVPPVALMQWSNEISEYTHGKLKVLIYHGTNTKAKMMSVKELKTYNVIMISYAGLESLYRKEVKGWTRGDKIIKEDSAMHAITFHRLILDEAHSIKSRTTGVAKACFALKGRYKWCLSGTPVQNRIGEFFSLLRFLDVTPFANYFCKECACSMPHWSMDAEYRCTHCKHRGLNHVSVFNQEILNPITSGDSDEIRKEALRKLRLLTDRIMLRRMKKDHTSSMELPPKEIILHKEFFGEIERDFSSSIMSNTARQFDTYVSRGVMLNNYANIFGLIMQMRQVSDHPDLLLKKHSDGGANVMVCNLCDEVCDEAIRSKCKHEFCRSCAKDFVRSCEGSGATPDCPRCHLNLAIDFDQPDIEQDEDSVKKSSIINRIKMENWTSSTKIEMLVYDLYKLRSKKQTLKSIVFSQFTSMLQLIEWRLRRAGFNTVMLDGSMTPAQRQKSIEHFMNNTNVEVFLVSLKAGGVALNLTEASRVFIVDPWWNPAAEWQSADRCHRIGQRRPCVITRLYIEDSVESRIVMLQEKKANMINGTVNNDEVAMDKLTPEDMQFLFRGS